ncbi:MAG: helix-turn-helix domain-containing protein [Prevotellaceae bacterium]|jgi:AraC-like DNA-binding protein|nr:helix-turn-helix domain-containing protein [Prevotellaceae bacterium]
MNKLLSLLLLISLPATAAQPLTIRHYEWSMHALQYPPTAGGDSVCDSSLNERRYFNSDSIFATIAREKRSPLGIDMLYYYYDDVLPLLPPDRQRREQVKMQAAAKRYSCPILRAEARNFALYTIPADSTGRADTRIEAMRRLADEFRVEGNTVMECWILFEIFRQLRLQFDFVQIFQHLPDLLHKLSLLTDEELPVRKSCYYYIGEAYYTFGDRQRGVECLRMALSDDTARVFADCANLRARRLLARHYSRQGMTDTSDYYFNSIYHSPDMVRLRPLFDAYAICGIARNHITRGQYADAIAQFRIGLAKLKTEKDHAYTALVAITLARCLLNEGQKGEVKTLVHEAQRYMALAKTSPMPYRNMVSAISRGELREAYYGLLYYYHGVNGNLTLALQYADSGRMVANNMLSQQSPLVILQGEQSRYETENLIKDQILHTQYVRNLLLGLLTLITLTALCIIVPLYTGKQRAYRELASRIRHWADEHPSLLAAMRSTQPSHQQVAPNNVDKAIMNKVNFMMTARRFYAEPDASVDVLAERMNVDRGRLLLAVSRCTGRNFPAYINEQRVREAIRILSDELSYALTTDDIALACGFDSRQTFYRIFKRDTGLSPIAFRNSLPRKGEENV